MSEFAERKKASEFLPVQVKEVVQNGKAKSAEDNQRTYNCIYLPVCAETHQAVWIKAKPRVAKSADRMEY